jgi:Transglycosylase SLT domain
VIDARRRTSITKIALAAGTMLLGLLLSAPQISATPHLKGSVHQPEVLRKQVVRLFDRLDRVSEVIERVRRDMASVDDRISALSRQVEAQERLLEERAVHAYMAGRAGEIDSVLGASSFTDLQDALAFLEAVSQEDHDLLHSLQHRRGELEHERRRLEALTEELRRRRVWLEATASDLVEELRRQRELRGVDGEAPGGSVHELTGSVISPAPIPQGSATGREAVTRLIRGRFATLGSRTIRVAICVVDAESGFDPLAVNPATGASGLFQFLPSMWESVSDLAGRTGASVFDAGANVAVAAWAVAHYGWHPWRSIAARCGA